MRSSRRASSGSPISPRFSPLLQYCLFGYVWIYGAATAFYVAIHVFSMLCSAISVLSKFVHLLLIFNFPFSPPFFFLAVLLSLDNRFSFRMLPLNSSNCSDHYSFGLLAPIHGINPGFQNFISFVQMGIKLGSQFMEPIHAHKLILVAQVLVPSRS